MTKQSANIDEIIEQQEDLLKFALAKAMQEMNKSATHANIRNYESARKAYAAYQERQSAPQERFKNMEQVAAWIISQGYIVSNRSVRNHADKPGFPKRQKDGSYLKNEIAVYAAANWDNPSKPTVDIPLNAAGRDELISEQVRKLRLANEITEGNYILRSLVEQEFSARASYLKRDLFNLGPRFIDRLTDKLSTLLKDAGVNIEEVNIHSLVPDLEAYWDRKIAEHLHEYSKARGFIPEQITQDAE